MWLAACGLFLSPGMAYAYQQMPADEPGNMDGRVNPQVIPESVMNPSFGDGGTKRSLQERQWVIFLQKNWRQLLTGRLQFIVCLWSLLQEW